MRLVPDKKLEKNLKLMRLCSQVKIIELTEGMSKISKQIMEQIDSEPALRKLLTRELNRQLFAANQPEIENPTAEDLLGVQLEKYEPSFETSVVYREYTNALRQYFGRQRALEDYQELTNLLSQEVVPLDDLHTLLDDRQFTTKSFQAFAKDMKASNPTILALRYKNKARTLIDRNNLQNVVYSDKLDKAFAAWDTEIALNDQFKGRTLGTATKLVAGAALAAVLVGAGFGWGHSTINDPVHTDPHGSGTSITGTLDPAGGPSTPDTGTAQNPTGGQIQENPIFSNSITINSYKTACQDFFQKTAEIYKYNTGKDISLTHLGQENIGINRNAVLFRVSVDGKTITISSQGNAAPNRNYLEKALKELGLSYSTFTSDTTYIHENDKSIAIVDGSGNPVRSGNVLVPASGAGYMYNQDMVNKGRGILMAQGRDKDSLTEGQCVAAYLISDQYTVQNDELSKALGYTGKLARYIKDTFYIKKDRYGTEKEDTFAVSQYAKQSQELAEEFTSTHPAHEQAQSEHDERD